MRSSSIFLLEEREEKRTLCFAIATGILFHIFLIFLKFPKTEFVLPALEENKPPTIIIKPPVFKQPEKIKEVKKPSARVVFIPDPTPEVPESIMETSNNVINEDIEIEDFQFGYPEEIPSPPEDNSVLIVDGREVMPPVRLTEISPVYPEAARRAGIEGYVILQLLIDKEGNANEVKVLKGLPFGLTEAAIEEAKKQKFKPAYSSSTGLPVNCIYTLTIRFKLN